MDALQTTFAGFLINGIMQPVVVFSVGKTTPTTTLGRITYDVVSIDTNLGWNTSSSYYVIPVTGTYVISLSSGAAGSTGHTMCLRTDNVLLTCIVMTGTRHTSETQALLTSLLLLLIFLQRVTHARCKLSIALFFNENL